METYLQTAWGDQWDYVTISIVREAIQLLMEMDDEHGAFWVGVMILEENVLEVTKNLELIGHFEEDPELQYKGQMNNWEEIEEIYSEFLLGRFDYIKTVLKPSS